MYKKFLKLFTICVCLFVSTEVFASFWDAWSSEDEELNMKPASNNSRRNYAKKSSKDKENYGEIGYDAYDSENFFNVDGLNNQKPIVICRQKGCTELNDKMTRNYLFNAIANLLYVNNKTKVYLCEANTSTRACLSNGLKYAVNIGGTAGVIYIPSITITDVSFSQNLKRISFMPLFN